MFIALANGRHEKWLTPQRIAMLMVIPVIMILGAATNELTGWVWSGYEFDPSNPHILIYYRGPLFWLGLAYAYIVLAIGSILLFITAFRYSSVFRMQTVAVVLASVFPIVSNVLYILRLGPLRYLNLTPLAFLISGLLIALSIFRFQMLELLPVARGQLIASIQDAIFVVDFNNNIVEVNQATQRIFGVDVANVIGKPVELVLNEWPDLLQCFLTLEKDTTRPSVIKIGSEQWFDIKCSSIRDYKGIVAGRLFILRDITDHKLMDEALRASEELYRSVTEQVTDGIVIVQDGLIKYANPKLMEMIDASVDEIVDAPFGRFLSPDQVEYVNSIYQRRMRGENVLSRYESALQQKTGEVLPVEMSVSLMEYRGKPAALASVNDISARYRAEREIRSYARQQELLNDIVRAALEHADLIDMLDVIADRLGELLDADGCYITLWDEENQAVTTATAHKSEREYFLNGPQPDPNEYSLTAAVLEEGRVIPIQDASNSPYISKRFIEAFPVKSLLGLPFIAGQTKLGAALVAYQEPHDFAPGDILLGGRAAQQIALAIMKNRLIEEERHQRLMAEAYQEMGKVLASSLKMNTVLDNMIKLIHEIVPFDAAAVLQVDDGLVKVLRSKGYQPGNGLVEPQSMSLDAMPGLKEVYQSNQYSILDRMGQQLGKASQYYGNGNDSWIGVPISFEDDVIAIFSLEKYTQDFYNAKHADSLMVFATQAALAIKNANLFEQVQQLAIIDPLTDIFNRRYFFTLLNREIIRSSRYDHCFSLMMLDIDHFKLVNDTHGHLVGDEVLVQFVKLCQSNLRSVDTISRCGGEEFFILSPELDSEGALLVAERLRKLVEETPLKTRVGEIFITVSIGVTTICGKDINSDDINKLDEIVGQVDRALYAAKDAGRNRVRLYDPD